MIRQVTTFGSLPIELREAVYLYAAEVPCKKEVMVNFLLCRKVQDEFGALDLKTSDLLGNIQAVSEDVYEDATECLTNTSVC